MKRLHISTHPTLLIVGSLLFAGCGQVGPVAESVDTVSAAGTLTSGGKALAFYQVTLVPQGNRPASATTDEQGHFVLGTNKPGDGAVAGKHKVVLSFVGPPSDITPDMDNYKPPKPTVKLNKKYGSESTTDLTVEVPDAGAEDLKIEVPAA